jgi:hypothetical protein
VGMGGGAPSEGWTAGNLKGGEEFRISFVSRILEFSISLASRILEFSISLASVGNGAIGGENSVGTGVVLN